METKHVQLIELKVNRVLIGWKVKNSFSGWWERCSQTLCRKHLGGETKLWINCALHSIERLRWHCGFDWLETTICTTIEVWSSDNWRTQVRIKWKSSSTHLRLYRYIQHNYSITYRKLIFLPTKVNHFFLQQVKFSVTKDVFHILCPSRKTFVAYHPATFLQNIVFKKFQTMLMTIYICWLVQH